LLNSETDHAARVVFPAPGSPFIIITPGVNNSFKNSTIILMLVIIISFGVVSDMSNSIFYTTPASVMLKCRKWASILSKFKSVEIGHNRYF